MLQGEGANNVGLTGITLRRRRHSAAGSGAAWCIASAGATSASPTAKSSGSGGNGIWLEQVSGDISGNIFRKIATTAVVSFDALGLIVSRNTITDTNDNGIEISAHGDRRRRHAWLRDNRIEDIKAGPGGSGQYGNAINAFRAGNVIVRGNRIRNCDYSAVRGNSASNIQNHGQQRQQRRARSRSIPSSRSKAAVIANNTVDGAAVGVSVCNFNEGGRIAVVQGNIIRNLLPKRPIGTAPDDDAGDRHLCRGGFVGDRQRDRERAVVRHHRRLGQISARRRDHGQRDPQAPSSASACRHAGRRHGAGQQQHDLGDPARRRRSASITRAPSPPTSSAEGAQRYRAGGCSAAMRVRR